MSRQEKGELILRRPFLWLLVTFVAVLAASRFLLASSYAADTSVGIGISKNGPGYATINSTISYSITVYNLGSTSITNVTITDLFPNLTTVSWSVPNLSPMGQQGDSYNLTNILYTVRQQDVTIGNPPFVDNHAAVTGVVTIQSFSETVSAITSVVTFTSVPVVGGFAVSISAGEHSTTTTYPVIVFMLVLALSISCISRRKRAHATTL
jgi:uncharacterized repeat protein (TIGR01451 family)